MKPHKSHQPDYDKIPIRELAQRCRVTRTAVIINNGQITGVVDAGKRGKDEKRRNIKKI